MFESFRSSLTYSWLGLQRGTLELECAQLSAEGIGTQVLLGGGQSWSLSGRVYSHVRVCSQWPTDADIVSS
jgi:hypothetical protein